jgi:hypothetical protein
MGSRVVHKELIYKMLSKYLINNVLYDNIHAMWITGKICGYLFGKILL